MRPRRPVKERGAIVLVALCFAAVLAISLASYLALSRSAMQLSNRTYQTDLSKYLAETGLEVAMDAFNTNDWSSWTISGTTATRTVTFAEGASKFGTVGVVGSIKLRVDNYNAYNLAATWVSTANYLPDNVVGHNGLWYRSLTVHSNKTPGTAANTAYWVPEHTSSASATAWVSGQSYAVGKTLIWNGSIYRCTAAHTSGSTTEPGKGGSWASYWVKVPYFSVDSDLHYEDESLLYYFGNWYRYYGGWQLWTGGGPWTTSWKWTNTTTYSLGDIVYHGGFYRYINTTPASNIAVTNPTYWQTVANDATALAANWPWSGSDSYTIGDVVYDGGSWYRCIRAHSNQRPPNSTYWSNAPALSREWDSKWQYSTNDTVFHDGRWHLSRTTNNYGNPPPTSPTTSNASWYSADHASMQWSASTAYAVNSYRSYGGVWYRCIAANTGRPPNNSSYWSAAWAQSSGVTTGAPVIYSEGIATPPGNSVPLRSQLRAVVGPLGLFPNALGVTDSFSLGGTTKVDSYDSVADPTAATPGASAVLAASAASGNAASLSSATVRGYVAAPGSNASAVTYAGSAQLNDGSAPASPAPSATNVDLARISRNPYIPRLGIQDVPGGTEITSLDNLVLGTPGAVTPSVYFYDNSSTMDLNTATENMTIMGPVILKVLGNGGLRIRSNAAARIRIAATGSLRLVINRDFRIDATGGGIVNETGDPAKCVVLLKRSGNDTFTYSFTGSPFYGVVYLPDSSSAFTLADGVKFYGAISAQKVTLNGAAELHYDTNLRHKPIPGVDPAFVIQDWRELFGTDRASL